MSYLFIKKISYKEKSLYYFHKKFKNLKFPKKTFLMCFFRWFFWVFLGGFFIANPATRCWISGRCRRQQQRDRWPGTAAGRAGSPLHLWDGPGWRPGTGGLSRSWDSANKKTSKHGLWQLHWESALKLRCVYAYIFLPIKVFSNRVEKDSVDTRFTSAESQKHLFSTVHKAYFCRHRRTTRNFFLRTNLLSPNTIPLFSALPPSLNASFSYFYPL